MPTIIRADRKSEDAQKEETQEEQSQDADRGQR